MKKIPELDFEEKKKRKGQMKVDETQRSKVSFECGKTGFYITLFFVHLLKTLKNAVPQGKPFDELSVILDSNHGCLDSKIEDSFQQDLFTIITVEDFSGYYKMAGVAESTDNKQLNERLVKAVKNSRRKGYHGQECDAQMPEVADQADTRAKDLIQQIADMKIDKEEINDIALEIDSTSDADEKKQ